jgi:uncharacterized membrane protein
MTTTLTPLLAVHVSAALSAVVLGPFALWARWGARQRPKLHRAFGYAWVTMMLVTATTAIFIKTGTFPATLLFKGYSPVHLLILVTYFSLFGAFWFLAKGKIRSHRFIMTNLYVWACLVAGGFTLMPGRFMHQWIWG